MRVSSLAEAQRYSGVLDVKISSWILALLVLAACSSAPQTRTLTSDFDGVSFAWSPEVTNIGEVTGLAQQYCAGFGKSASLANNSSASPENTLYATTYRCVQPPKPSS
jgi:hypothetical protein